MEEIVRREILNKNQTSRTYYATGNTIKKVETDFDNFPYNRWYRGKYQVSEPVIIERETGYRPIEKCEIPYHEEESTVALPNHCFESACSVVYPCYGGNKEINYKEKKVVIKNKCVPMSV